jgi:hypothetical protein
MKKFIVIFLLLLAIAFPLMNVLAQGTAFDPYDPSTVPPTGFYTANVFPAGSTLNNLYCPSQTNRGYLPQSFFPATLFPQDAIVNAKTGSWTFDNDEWTYANNNWQVMFERLNGKSVADNKVLAGFNGQTFPNPPTRKRTDIFPSSGNPNDLYFNPVNIIQVKFRHVNGSSQWYGEVQTIPYGSTDPNTITIANTPEYLMQHQTNCNSEGGFQSSLDDWGVNTYIPLVSKNPVWVPLALMTYRGQTLTPIAQTVTTYTAIGNENIRFGPGASYNSLGIYILTGETVSGVVQGNWLQISTIDGQPASGYCTMAYLETQ